MALREQEIRESQKRGPARVRAAIEIAELPLIDLQYGDTAAERDYVGHETGIRIEHLDDIDNTEDIDALAALITVCDLVVTVSNTTAHLAGALGKETCVLVPFGQARMWYLVP